MNDSRSSESCRKVSSLPRAAEQHLLVRDQPAQTHRVHRHAVDGGAARPGQPGRGRVGHRPEPRLRTGLRDQRRGALRGAGRGVDLVRMVQLDDLDRLVVPGRLAGEPHHQHRTEREVGGDQDTDGGCCRQHLPHGVEPRVVEPGGADDGVHPAGHQGADVVEHGRRCGEVDRHLRARRHRLGRRVVHAVGHVAGRHQHEVRSGVHRAAHRAAHPAAGAEDGDAGQPGHQATAAGNVRVCSNGPITASVGGAASNVSATSRTSSSVTASMRRRSSDTPSSSP